MTSAFSFYSLELSDPFCEARAGVISPGTVHDRTSVRASSVLAHVALIGSFVFALGCRIPPQLTRTSQREAYTQTFAITGCNGRPSGCHRDASFFHGGDEFERCDEWTTRCTEALDKVFSAFLGRGWAQIRRIYGGMLLVDFEGTPPPLRGIVEFDIVLHPTYPDCVVIGGAGHFRIDYPGTNTRVLDFDFVVQRRAHSIERLERAPTGSNPYLDIGIDVVPRWLPEDRLVSPDPFDSSVTYRISLERAVNRRAWRLADGDHLVLRGAPSSDGRCKDEGAPSRPRTPTPDRATHFATLRFDDTQYRDAYWIEVPTWVPWFMAKPILHMSR